MSVFANSFRGTASTFARPQFFRFLSVGTLKPPSVFKPITTAPRPLEECNIPRSDVSMCALIQMEMCVVIKCNIVNVLR